LVEQGGDINAPYLPTAEDRAEMHAHFDRVEVRYGYE
jgi:hypothetical protein